MICPLCKKLRLIAKHFWHSRYKPIRCCMDCYNKMKANRVARIKAEQRRILRDNKESIERMLKKILPNLYEVVEEEDGREKKSR